MALSDAVLNEFFNKTKKPFLSQYEKETSQTYKPSRYRVFDDPVNENDSPAKIIKNLGQIKDKSRTKSGQTKGKLRTNAGQEKRLPRDDVENSGQSQYKYRTQPRTQPRTNIGQTKDNQAVTYNFSSLVGLQRKITLFIYDTCQFCRSNTTNSLAIEHIAISCQTTKLSAHKTLQRLEKKNIIFRDSFKNGRGGWTRYKLSDSVFQEIAQEEIQLKLRTNQGQTTDKDRTEPRTEPRTSLSSSSSKNMLNSNVETTTTCGGGVIPEEFEGIDIEALRQYGFTEKHLIQIIERSGFTKEMIQDSLDAFSFDLRKNNKAAKLKSTPLNCIMGTLTKGRHYNPPENYMSPKQESARQYLEAKKYEKEKEKKLQQEAMELAFYAWKSTMRNEEIEALIDDILKDSVDFVRKEIRTRENSLYLHYEKNIWPDEKDNFFK